MIYDRVQPGDYVLKIATRNGFADYHTLWNHPKNALLKQKRHNPNTLVPGDVLFIPDKQQRQVSRSTGNTHHFAISAPRVRLRIVLLIEGREPKQAECWWDAPGKNDTLYSDGDGLIEQEIPVTLANGDLRVYDPESTYESAPMFHAKVGYLYPVEEPQGQMARLHNMGYYLGPEGQIDPYAFRSALEEFQCDYGLPVSGKCDASTRQRLVEVYGC